MVGKHKWLYAHYTHPDVILNQFINVHIIDGWNAQMTLCSLHPPRRHIESVYQRSCNCWLGTHKWLYAHYTHPDVILNQFIKVRVIDGWKAHMTLCSLHPPRRHINQFINVPIIDWNAQMTICSLHPPRRHIESVYQCTYNWWLGSTNDSMLIHPPRRHIESVYQRSYNWWLERTNDSMLITPTQTSYWISLSTFLVNWWLGISTIIDGWEAANDSMLITPTQTSYWISLSKFV